MFDNEEVDGTIRFQSKFVISGRTGKGKHVGRTVTTMNDGTQIMSEWEEYGSTAKPNHFVSLLLSTVFLLFLIVIYGLAS